jgi:alpha-glucosidase (family GH31 glycosyl hydrolase)
MINYAGLFGMPNVGPSLCNYDGITPRKDEDLCARYFQLSIIAPLSVYIDGQSVLDNHPWNFKDKEAQLKIAYYLKERARLTLYMRSQLSLIE